MTTAQFDAWTDSEDGQTWQEFMAEQETAELEALHNFPAYLEWCDHQDRVCTEYRASEIMRVF